MYEENNIEPQFGKRVQNPFKTPENYFGSLEDRIMGGINDQTAKKKAASPNSIIRFVKPVLAIAASFTLIYMLAYYPVNKYLLKGTAHSELTKATASDSLADYAYNIAAIDENSLIDVIFTDESNNLTETNPEEFLAYLSSGLNDVEIYSEIQK